MNANKECRGDTYGINTGDPIKHNPLEQFKGVISIEQNNSLQSVYNALAEVLTFKHIKYQEGSEDAIKGYKNASYQIKKFRTRLTKVRKEVAKPYKAVDKMLINFEKQINGEATEVLEYLQAEFKPFIDEVARKRQEALDRKMEKEKAKIEELTETQDANILLIERLKNINTFKDNNVSRINEVNSAIANYKTEVLKDYLDIIKSKILLIDLSILNETQREKVEKEWKENINLCVSLIEKELNNRQLLEIDKIEVKEYKTLNVSFNTYASNVLNDTVKKIKLFAVSNDNEKTLQDNLINHLNKVISKF